MPQQSSPLLDQYNQDGIVTPALQQALDAARQKLPQIQLQGAGAAASPSAPMPMLKPPGAGVPSITRPGAATPGEQAPMPGPGLIPGSQTPGAQPMPGPGLVAPSGEPSPSTPAPAGPRITDQDTKDFAERNRLVNTGSGRSQIKNPVLRTLAGIGDIAGSSFFPNITSQIPGTELHHEGLVKRAEGTVNQDVSRAKENAGTAETQKRTAGLPTAEEAEASRAAETRERNAQAENLEHPRPKDLTDLYLRDNPNATAADLATFLQKDYESRESARAAAEAANREPNQYADFKSGFMKQNPDATPDQVVEAFKKSQKTATETSAEDDQKYEALVKKQKLGQVLTPEDKASMAAYRDRKTVGQQTTNVYANERADRTESSKKATELHKTLMSEFSAAQTQLDNAAQARADLAANPVGQNIGTIKTIVALAGGTGSGVRITQPELNSLASNLGIKTSFGNWLSSIEGQGKFSPETLKQINQVLDGVAKLGEDKKAKLNGTLDSLQDAKSTDDVNRIEREYRHGLGQSGEPKVGDTKTFPNGKVGVWDGKGYVAKP